MLTFTHLGRLGRLGNQLFQYATLRAVGNKNRYEVKIPDPDYMKWHGQNCLLKHFNIESDFLVEKDLREIRHVYTEKNHMQASLDVFNVPDNTDLYGFFQNTEYFSDYEKCIREEFTFKRELDMAAQEYIDSVCSKGVELVSLHIRRGDNTDGTNPTYGSFYGKAGKFEWDSLYGTYLKQAMSKFANKNVKYLIFTGGSRNNKVGNDEDVKWCKKYFNAAGGEKYLYSEGNSDIMDLAIMTKCDHNIMCHSTSYGWWAAYLNRNKNKIVVAPRYYLIEEQTLERKGFYPENFILV